jgi:hypothetical protein
MDDLLMKAKKAREESAARSRLHQSLVESGADPTTVNLIEDVTLGGMGSDFHGATGGVGDLQKQGLQRQMTAAATGGDIDLANALTVPFSGKPLVQSKVEGQNIISPYDDPTEQSIVTTPQGESVIKRNEANATKALRVPAPKAAALAADPAQRAIFNAHVKDVMAEYEAQLDDPTVNPETARVERDKKLEALGVPSRIGGSKDKEAFIRSVEHDLGKPLTDDERARVTQSTDGSWTLSQAPLTADEIGTSSARSKAEGAQSPTPVNRSGKPIPVTDPTAVPGMVAEQVSDLPDAMPMYTPVTTNPPAASDKPVQPKKSGKGSINREAFKGAWNAIKGGNVRAAVVQRLREHGYNREADQLLKQLP